MPRSMGEWDRGDDRRRDDDRVVVLHLDDSQVEGAAGAEARLEEGLFGQG